MSIQFSLAPGSVNVWPCGFTSMPRSTTRTKWRQFFRMWRTARTSMRRAAEAQQEAFLALPYGDPRRERLLDRIINPPLYIPEDPRG